MLANDGEADYTNPIFKNPLSAVLAKYALKNSEIIVQNNYQKERLLEKGIKSIIFTNKFNINKNNIKKKRYILWVGRLDENYKRPELFVELSKEFPKEKFIMIAPEATNQETYRKKIIKSLSKNIRLIDFVEFNKIQSYFNRAKIFVNTSSQEGFPNTFIQSGIGKTPIISLKVDPDNFIKKNNCGYICNDNPNLMKKSLEKLLKNKNDWKIKSKNLYNYVKKNHNIKNSKIAEIIK
jgi:glycosyltransferase involved in cell wall biosynthesis